MRYFPAPVRPAFLQAACVVLLAVGCTPAKTGTPAGGGTGGSGNGPGTGGSGAGTGGGPVTGSGGSTGSGGDALGGTGGTGTGATGGITTATGGGGGPVGGASGGRPGSGGGVGTGGGTMVVKTACPDAPFVDPYSPGYSEAQHQPFLMQAQTMLSTMTLADKAGQMRGTPHGTGQYTDIFRTTDNPTRGIKGFLFRDGPRGVNLDAPLPSLASGGRSTVFPAPMARAASWDLDLELRIGEAMGDEMVATGQTMLLAPTANILRHPLWGRAQETYGEDPYQLGRLSNASIVGIQHYVPACAKHYAANNIENNRFGLNAQMDEQTLREIYSRHYEMMVRDGGVACIMAAYNAVNGVKSTQDKHILTDVLRTDFGFKGFVLSDWWAMPGASSPTLATGSRSTNAAQAVIAGMDMELPWSLNYGVLETITGTGLPISDAVLNT
ncbi:MAG: glycoside hydrolase family 3 protein, partial [Deltaproteobacteria bacterium]|nr:glycoside hydrolase family 3 protein [Deltaproteobacteria bacterium]